MQWTDGAAPGTSYGTDEHGSDQCWHGLWAALLALQAAFCSSTRNQCTEFLVELNKLQKHLNYKLRKDYDHKPANIKTFKGWNSSIKQLWKLAQCRYGNLQNSFDGSMVFSLSLQALLIKLQLYTSSTWWNKWFIELNYTVQLTYIISVAFIAGTTIAHNHSGTFTCFLHRLCWKSRGASSTFDCNAFEFNDEV